MINAPSFQPLGIDLLKVHPMHFWVVTKSLVFESKDLNVCVWNHNWSNYVAWWIAL